MIFRRITLMLILSFAACASFYAQKGWGIEGSAFLSSPYGNYIADLGVTHYWNFMKYGTIGMGAKFSYVNTSNLGEWYTDTERYAFNDDENFLVSLDGVTTIGCYIPVLKQTGVFCDASVTFSLIPIDWIDIKKYNHDNPINYELHSISPLIISRQRLFLDLASIMTLYRMMPSLVYYWDMGMDIMMLSEVAVMQPLMGNIWATIYRAQNIFIE